LTVAKALEEPKVTRIHFEAQDWKKFLSIETIDTKTGVYMAQDI